MPSAAPSLDALYDFEGQLEAVVYRIMKAAGLTILDAELYRDPNAAEELPIPDSGHIVEFDIGAATGDRVQKSDDGSGFSEYGIYQGSFRITGAVPVTPPPAAGGRAEFVKNLRKARARCRVLFMDSRLPFTDQNSPWLDVGEILPMAPQKRPDQARGVNIFILEWKFKFAIRSTAWPAGA